MDPAPFSFAHGGEDRQPFPAPLRDLVKKRSQHEFKLFTTSLANGGYHDPSFALGRSPSDCPVLSLLIGDPTYMKNPLRQDLWRAGHAHARVWLILALVALRYVDEANLSDAMKWVVRGSIPLAVILVPAAFFLSVLSPEATAPNGLIYHAYVGAALLAVGVVVLGIGLVKRPVRT